MVRYEKNKVLSDRIFYNTFTYDQWFNLIETTNEHWMFESLLYKGLQRDVNDGEKYKYIDAVCKYIDIAFGYLNYFSFSFGEHSDKTMQIEIGKERNLHSVGLPRVKQERYAQKAFSELCRRVLKDEQAQNKFKAAYYEPSWWNHLLYYEKDRRVFHALLEFFEFKENIPTKAETDIEKITVDFLYKLSTAAWSCHFSEYKKIPEILIKNRDHFIKVLWSLNELDFLKKNWELLALEDFRTIEDLAMDISDGSKTISFEQALTCNSKMAECYEIIRRKLEISGKVLLKRAKIIEMQGN